MFFPIIIEIDKVFLKVAYFRVTEHALDRNVASQPILKPCIVRQCLATLLRVTETVLNQNVVFSTQRFVYLNYKLCILRQFLLITLFRLTKNATLFLPRVRTWFKSERCLLN